MVKNLIQRLYTFFSYELWTLDLTSLGRLRAFLIDSLRIVTVVIRDVLYGEITLRATGLVYTTLLSLVPLLAVSFSVLKAFGVHNAAEPFLLSLLDPLGPWGADLAGRIVAFVNNMKVGVLGFVGLGLLIYTVISLIQKVEEAFNAIWRVRSMRSVLQRFSDYLSVVLVGPVLVVSALGLTATLMSTTLMEKLTAIGPVGVIVFSVGKLVPYVLVCAAFAFVYVFVPNTKVRFGPALTGAVAGGVLWETVGWGFGSFIVASTRYGAIYSGFAVLILFMIWLYLSWLILLVGAEVAFYRQNPQYLSLAADKRLPDTRLIEHTALSIMFLIARHFYLDKPPWTSQALAQRLRISPENIEDIVAALRKARLVAETVGDPPAFLPARDIGTIALRDVYDAVRGSGSLGGPQAIASIESVEDIVTMVDQAIGISLDSRTLRDLVGSRETDGAQEGSRTELRIRR